MGGCLFTFKSKTGETASIFQEEEFWLLPEIYKE